MIEVRSPEVQKPGFCTRYRLRSKGDLKNPVSFVGGRKGRSPPSFANPKKAIAWDFLYLVGWAESLDSVLLANLQTCPPYNLTKMSFRTSSVLDTRV